VSLTPATDAQATTGAGAIGVRERVRAVILGAAGRDFHDFNVVYRDDPGIEVVAFTAAQIEGIADRRYPPSLAGPLYPAGIPVVAEEALERTCREHGVRLVVFAYSDASHLEVMHRASRALASGADFLLLSPDRTWLRSRLPVMAVSAVRTGCGKSQTARWLSQVARDAGRRVSVMRHPMPYGDLEREAVQRFAVVEDIDAAGCTIEEREEYEPHLAAGNVVFAGVDYARVLDAAEREGDLILWDGGNNDFPFVKPDLHLVLVDPLRAGDETTYHPGEAVLRSADVVVVAKSDSADAERVGQVEAAVRRVNGRAEVVRAGSRITLDPQVELRGRRVLVVEDGPTTTHGGLPHGAGYAAAVRSGATVLDPRPYAAPALAKVYARYPHLGPVLPAMGYSVEQQAALAESIARAPVDFVVAGTPIDLARVLSSSKPIVRARYDFVEDPAGRLREIVARFFASRPGSPTAR
jgi:predicted GTPase